MLNQAATQEFIEAYVSLLLATSSEHYEDSYLICAKVFIYSVTNGYKIQI